MSALSAAQKQAPAPPPPPTTQPQQPASHIANQPNQAHPPPPNQAPVATLSSSDGQNSNQSVSESSITITGANNADGTNNGALKPSPPQNGQNNSVTSSSNGNMSGYLFKWTNYLKGYQKRWIFLNNGFLSYYR